MPGCTPQSTAACGLIREAPFLGTYNSMLNVNLDAGSRRLQSPGSFHAALSWGFAFCEAAFGIPSAQLGQEAGLQGLPTQSSGACPDGRRAALMPQSSSADDRRTKDWGVT